MKKILQRKIITASISSTLFAILLGFIYPDAIEPITSLQDYISLVCVSVPAYIIYSFPIILIYGVATSIFSDKVGKLVSEKSRKPKMELIASGVMHLIFGLILLGVSLFPSILFFLTDIILRRRKKEYKWVQALFSLVIPIIVVFLFWKVAEFFL